MKPWKRNKATTQVPPSALSVQTAGDRRPLQAYDSLAFFGKHPTETRRLYRALREAIPVVDAAIGKLVRLLGGFTVQCESPTAEDAVGRFLQQVPVNGMQVSIYEFLSVYFEQLLTYGTAVGEIVLTPSGSDIAALYNASLDDLEFRQGASPLHRQIFRKQADGGLEPISYPELVLTTALRPQDGKGWGVSVLHSLPFVSEILMQIYRTIGINWERIGNVRFAVTYQPTGDSADRANAKADAEQMAQAWSNAMQSGGQVSDFVAVGNVQVKVIGADNQILDSQIPVRQMLEQIVAALGVPPFLLGFAWSSTERMSSQQADILTSELESYRRMLTPVVQKIASLWLTLHGFLPNCTVVWEDITLQDAVDLAEARLKHAQAAQIEAALAGKEAI